MNRKQLMYENIIREAVRQSINEAINENDEDEGFFNRVGSAIKGFAGRSNSGYQGNQGDPTPTYNLKSRFNAARAGYREQGNIDAQDDVINAGQTMLNAGFSPDTTIGQAMRRAKVLKGGANGRFTQATQKIYQ